MTIVSLRRRCQRVRISLARSVQIRQRMRSKCSQNCWRWGASLLLDGQIADAVSFALSKKRGVTGAYLNR